MFWRILKAVLSIVTINVKYYQGDLVRVVITFRGKTVLNRTIDLIRGA